MNLPAIEGWEKIMREVAKIDPKPWMRDPGIEQVFFALTANGGTARFVGGCVRDTLVGRAIKDIDIATDLLPDEVMQRLDAASISYIKTGIDYGTVVALIDEYSKDHRLVIGKRNIDITTLRRDVETYGRHAKVEFTNDWDEDAKRRDLTINALYASPAGNIYDALGGYEDLMRGDIRFIGSPRERIEEDVLRILRYFRFYAVFPDSSFNDEALNACSELAPKLSELSGERMRDEFLRILGSPEPASTIRMMKEEGVLDYVIPYDGDFRYLENLAWIERHCTNLPGVEVDVLRRLSTLIDGKIDLAEKIAEKFHLSNQQRTRLLAIVFPPIEPVPGMEDRLVRKGLHNFGAEKFRDFVILKWAKDRALADKTELTQIEKWHDLLDAAMSWRPLEFCIRGKDVTARGVPEGPKVGEVLSKLENWWQEHDFRPNHDEMLAQLDLIIASIKK